MENPTGNITITATGKGTIHATRKGVLVCGSKHTPANIRPTTDSVTCKRCIKATAADATWTDTSTVTETWDLTDEELTRTVERLTKINQRAAARDLDGGYTYTVDPDYREVTRYYTDPETLREIRYTANVRTVRVTGTIPAFDGWTFLARLTFTHDSTGVLIEGGPLLSDHAASVDPYRDTPNWCDHCSKNRRRKESYILINTNGETKQVGGSCLKDFLGHTFESGEFTKSDLFGTAVRKENPLNVVPVEVILIYAACIIRTEGGFAPRRAGAQATASLLAAALNPRTTPDKKWAETVGPEDEDEATANQALTWIRTVDRTGDNFIANLQELAKGEEGHLKNAGLYAALIPAYHRHLGYEYERDIKRRAEAAAREEAAARSTHVGEPKQRLNLTGLTVTEVRTYESAWGAGRVVTFHDATGSVLKWWTSKGHELTVGDVVDVRATVKSHGEYRGVAETTLTRAVVTTKAVALA